jgi:hypothetical protein
MAPSRRRTSSGIPIAVIVAVLTALFAVFGSRNRAAPSPGGTAPTATASSPTPTRTRAGGTGAATKRSSDVASATPSRSNSPGFASRQRLTEHYEKHGAEFPGFSLDQYLGAAQALRDAPVSATVLEVRRRDGVVTRFDRQSGAFLAANRDGSIRTFFRPNDGESYFRRQASRTPGGGA